MYVDRVVILGIPHATNNGSAMMAINTIEAISSFCKNEIEFYCDFSTEKDKERIQAEISYGIKLYLLSLPQFRRGKNILTSFWNRMIWIKNAEKRIYELKPKAIIVLGGDDFSEYYSGYKIIVRLYFIYRLSRHFRVFMIGHTIGPFYSWRKFIAGFFLAKCYILTRDEPSVEYCTDILGLKKVKRGYDIAWLDLPKQSINVQKQLLDRYELTPDNYVVIVPSALVNQYTKFIDDYLDTWVEIVYILQNRKLLSDKKIVFMPHVFKDKKNDDREIIKFLEKRISFKENICFIYDQLLPSECRALLSACLFSIACRMHASLSTIQTFKPSIAISYSVKYSRVICDAGLSDLIIEARDDIMWKGILIKQLDKRITTIENNYEKLCKRIQQYVSSIKEKQSKLFGEYSAMIFNNK